MKKLIFALIIISMLLISCGSNQSDNLLNQRFDALDQLFSQMETLEQDWYENLKNENKFQNGKTIHDEYYDLCIKYHYQREQFVNFLNSNPEALDSLTMEQIEYVNEISWENYETCIDNVNMMRTTLNEIYKQQLYTSVQKESFTMV